MDQKFLEKLLVVEYAIKAPAATKMDLLDKYNKLADMATDKSSISSSIVRDNLNCYSILMNKTLFISVLTSVGIAGLANYKYLDDIRKACELLKLRNNLKTNTYAFMYTNIINKLKDELPIEETVNPELIETALTSFGLAEAKESDVGVDFVGNKEIDLDIDFDGDETLEDTVETEELNVDTSEDEIDLDIEDGNSEESVDTLEQEESNNDDKNTNLIEAFKEVYGAEDENSKTPLRTAIDGILVSFRELYESCFSGITTPDGILTQNGILSFDKVGSGRRFVYNHSADNTSKEYFKNKGIYGQYYKSVMYALGVVLGGATEVNNNDDADKRKACMNNAVSTGEHLFGVVIDGRKDTTPKYADVHNNLYMYPRFHTEFMTGYFDLSNKMKDWAVQNNARRSGIRITRYDDIERWARKRVSDCLTEACLDAGLKIEDVGENNELLTSICQTMSNSIKNIIVITNLKKSHYTLKICNNKPINADRLASVMSRYINSSGSQAANIIVKNNGKTAGVIELDVVLNQADYDKASSFSADVIDAIIDSGQVPSWNNAILGEKNNGGTLTFDFTKSCSIAIYGASGSGKGIMTSSLLSNAIADGCEVFYFDGKPDNGAALAKIAWDNTQNDAPVFNGCTGGSDTFQDYLENYSHGIRNVNLRNLTLNSIPTLDDNESWPFRDSVARKQLSEITLTLQAYQFVHDMILARTNSDNVEMLGNQGKNAGKRWAVFVIDEIQDAAGTEKIVRNLMAKYMETVGEREVYKTETKTNNKGNTETIQKRDGKIKDPRNWDKDTGYLFCKKWLTWADSRCIQWENVVTKSIRNSSSTLITIFQSNNWLKQNGNGAGNTKIGKLMLTIAQKTTKIVGKGALVSDNQWGDDTEYSWTGETAKGKWAISKGENGLSDDAVIFKPFKVFTTDLGDKVMVPPDDRGAGSQGCWQSRDNQQGKKPLGLQSYIKYLFNGLSNEIQEQVNTGERLPETVTPEGVLISSFNYMDSVIRKLHDPQGLLHYMYDIDVITKFDGKISSAELEAASNYENSQLSEQDKLDALNIGIGEDEEPLDFGGPEETSGQTGNTQNPISQGTGNVAESAFERESRQMLDDVKKHAVDKTVKLMSTAVLNNRVSSGKLNTETIEYYVTRYLEPVIIGRTMIDMADRDMGHPNSLYHQFLVYSNLHLLSYRLNAIDNYNQYIGELVNSKERTPETFKIAAYLYAMQAYTEGTLDYDKLPSKEMLAGWMQDFLNPIKDIPDDDAFDGFVTDTPFTAEFGSPSEIEIGNIGRIPVYKQGKDGIITMERGQFANMVQLPMDSSLLQPLSFLERRKKSLYESETGTSYLMNKYWTYVLNHIKKQFKGDTLRVTKIVIETPHTIMVNKTFIGLEALLHNPEDYVELVDIVNIHKLFSTFPAIQELILDADISSVLTDEYGSTAHDIWRIFQENKKLKYISLKDYNQNTIRHNRESFAETARQLDENLSEQEVRKIITVQGQSKNPRLKENPQMMYRVHKSMIGNASDYFKKGHEIMVGDGEKSFRKWTKFTLLGLGSVVVGGIAGIPQIFKRK